MNESLSDAISQSVRAAKFCCGGTLPVSDPGIELKNSTVLRFPLKPKSLKLLVEQCQVAPFGKGTKTLVDRKVRRTLELSPRHFQLSDEWNAAIDDVTRTIAIELGLPPDKLTPKLYKLLVYKAGGFFAPHRDSEKDNGMVASLIVVLPNQFEGGTLVVRHSPSREQQFPFREAASAENAGYAAFYADCEHEVRHVHSGVRVCLAYNLILRPGRKVKGVRTKASDSGNPLVASVRSWFTAQPSKPLVFALEHHYTGRGLSKELLKGTDRSLSDLLVSVAQEADCHIHLAQVTRHLCQFADDGSIDEWYRPASRGQSSRSRSLQIGETYTDELLGTQWTDLSGKKQSWGDMPFEISSIVSAIPIDDWKPTSEEYEGYTGNAGNTLDRWYHRSAVVLWPTAQHYAVIAASGPETCIPLFIKLMSKLAKAAKSRKEAVRAECIAFARAIIRTWPEVYPHRRRLSTGDRSDSVYDLFRDQLVALNDKETINQLLMQVAVCDQTLALVDLVQHACTEFGIAEMATSLRTLLMPRPENRWRQDVPIRDMEWLAAVCQIQSPDADDQRAVRELCSMAVARFSEPYPEPNQSGYRYDPPEKSAAESALPHLLRALLASGCDDEITNVIRFVEQNPSQFTLEYGQVPTLKMLVTWTFKCFGKVPEPLLRWLESVRKQLESATASEPQPPSDWTRPSRISCHCEYCGRLSAFLQDATSETGRIAARESIRQHLISMIQNHQFDVRYTLQRSGSPHALVLTKTQGSYERALRRYQLDTKLLKSLPSAQS